MRAKYNFDNIIGRSTAIQQAYLLAARVADSTASVLVLGETGTGKEYLARTIHYQSGRASGPFIAVNCSALPETLLESELFGHEKGAFTSAVGRHIGRFELAHGGTLFLDEIGDVNAAVQVKLLRVLQTRQFERVGGSETINADVRVIAATNKDITTAISSGDLREDLYYRLATVTITLPPLRERPEDIPALATRFAERFAGEAAKDALTITPGAMASLQRHPWPGNIRELENCLQRASILTFGDAITEADLMLPEPAAAQASSPAPLPAPAAVARAASADGDLSLKEAERKHIVAVLAQCGGNQSQAARLLGIDRKTLRLKARTFGLGDDSPDGDE